MSNPFFDHPILNSPYAYPIRHWELDESGQATQKTMRPVAGRNSSRPFPSRKKASGRLCRKKLSFDEGKGISTKDQQYDLTSVINEVRGYADAWRSLPNPAQ
jgi:type III restriction enzyme